MAESLAGECDAHYTKICGSDLETKWVGETEANWRKLFQTAKENQPAIIFIDEFDSVAKSRDGANNSEHGSKVVPLCPKISEQTTIWTMQSTNTP